MDAARAAHGLAAAAQLLIDRAGGTSRKTDDAILCRSEHPLSSPYFNLAAPLRPVPVETLEEYRRFYEPGWPFALRLSESVHTDLAAEATDAGFAPRAPSDGAPIMAAPSSLSPVGSFEFISVDSTDSADFFLGLLRAAYTLGDSAMAAVSGLLRPSLVGVEAVRSVVIVNHAAPVACAMVVLSSVASVHWVGTVPQARRAGFGRAATQWCIREAAQAGYAEVVLTASPDGQRLYEAMSFTGVDRHFLFSGQGRKSQ